MIFLFSSDDGQAHSRSRYLRGGLLRDFHCVRVVRDFSRAPQGHFWLHGLSRHPSAPLDGAISRAMETFPGKIGFFQNDDGCEFFLSRIPASLRNRAVLFMRNHWPADAGQIPAEIRDRSGFLNPLLKPLAERAGLELNDRRLGITFYGSSTGTAGNNGRTHAVRLLKQAGLPFTGGLIEYADVPKPPYDCIVPAIGAREHGKLLSRSKICLTLHGNCALTYRLFEGLSRRCLVLAQDLSSLRFADCGLKLGVHYAPVNADLSDLVEKARYYLEHTGEAQKIADMGFEHFKRNFRFSGVNLPQPLYKEIISSWRNIEVGQGKATPVGLLTRLLLPLLHSV